MSAGVINFSMNILNILQEVKYIDIKFPFGYRRDNKIFENASFLCQEKEDNYITKYFFHEV